MRDPTVAALCVASLVLAAGPTCADAQEPGVHIDHGSPSAKEYALPLEEARRDASGGSKTSVKPGDRSAPLFGEGVGSDSAAASKTGHASASGYGHLRAMHRPRRVQTRRVQSHRSAASTAVGSATVLSGSSALALGGLGLLALVAAGGALARAMRGPRP